MTAFLETLVHYAKLPALVIVEAVLALFDIRLAYLSEQLQAIIVGFVAFFFWGHVIRITLTLVLRKVFGYYGRGA
ncbi:hypothetical protein DS891_01415 [Pseudoalteromonas sp. JC28]|uniref:hypothetical protein n=1 Tax=Pseudoalteromonas sp. JC28 TaxID=2267617 RepID=UPI001573A56A|nr:hypothetical protein [Pseudoalteromonas sp. JC28]NSY32267.1 hypothetical protein [Pseudoalteromonas sp. JC28]